MMSCKIISEKRVIIALFSILLFTSCAQKPRQWQMKTNAGTHQNFRSSRLYLAPEDRFSGLEIDILNTSQGKVTYINAFGLELQPEGTSLEGYPLITVIVKIDEQSQEFKGFLLQGGHRILLSDQASRLIEEALLQHKQVELSVAHYSTTITSDQFSKHYQKLIQTQR